MKTEVWGFQTFTKEAPQEVKDVHRKTSRLTFASSGIMESDDADNWNQCVAASKSLVGRRYPQVLSMGLGTEEDRGQLPGIWTRSSVNETKQRYQYRRWQQMMDAESWADIPIYPPTAKYEGTATFRG